MAAKNRDILFVIKMKNQAQSAIRQFGGDLKQAAAAARQVQAEFKNIKTATNGAATGLRSVKTAADGLGKSQGITQLQQQLKKVETQAATTASKVRGSFANLGNANPGRTIAAGFAPLPGLLGNIKNQAVALGGALGASLLGGSAIAYTVKAIANFEQALSGIQAVTDLTASEMERVKKAAMDAGAATVFSSTEAANAMGELVKAGLSAQQAIETLVPTLNLASAGQLSLEEAAAVTANTLSIFGLAATDSTKVADILAKAAASSTIDIRELFEALKYGGPVAKAFNVSINETVGAIAALGNKGVKGSAAGTSIRALINDLKILSSGGGTKQAQEVLKNLKIDPANIDPQRVGLSKAIKALKDAGASAADLLILFQERNAGNVASLVGDYDNLTKSIELTKNATGEADKQARTRVNNLTGAFNELESAIENASIKLGELGAKSALTQLTQVATGVVRIFSGVAPSIGELDGVAQKVATTISGIGRALAFVAGVKTFNALASGALSLGTAVTGTIGKINSMTAALGAAAQNAGLLRAGFVTALGGVGIAIAAVAGSIYLLRDRTVETTAGAVKLGDVYSFNMERIKSVVVDAANKMGGSFKDFGELVNGIADHMAQGFADVPRVFTLLYTFITSLWGNLPEILKGIGAKAANLLIRPFETAINTITEGLNKFRSLAGQELIPPLKLQLDDSGFSNGVGKAANDALRALEQYDKDLAKIGQDRQKREYAEAQAFTENERRKYAAARAIAQQAVTAAPAAGTDLTTTQAPQQDHIGGDLASQTDKLKTFNENFQKQLQDIRQQSILLGLSADQQERMNTMLQFERDAREAGIKNIDEYRQKMLEATAALEAAKKRAAADEKLKDFNKEFKDTLTDLAKQGAAIKLNSKDQDRFNKLLQFELDARKAGITDIDTYRQKYINALDAIEVAQKKLNADAGAGFAEGLREYADQATNLREAYKGVASGIAGDISGALKGALRGEGLNWRELASNIIGRFTDTAVDYIVGTFSKGLAGAFGSATEQSTSNLSQQAQQAATQIAAQEKQITSMLPQRLQEVHIQTAEGVDAAGKNFVSQLQTAYQSVVAGIQNIGGGANASMTEAQQRAAYGQGQKAAADALKTSNTPDQLNNAGNIFVQGIQTAYQKAVDGVNNLSSMIPAARPQGASFQGGVGPGGLFPSNTATGTVKLDPSAMSSLTQSVQSSNQLAMQYIAKFESFSNKAYWDVNAYRAGYGSDTVTLADGSVVAINKNSIVSMADAQRDLLRRTPEFMKTAENKIGTQTFTQLNPQTQAALTSIAYNYGTIPNRLLPAIKSLDTEKIARAVEGLRADNKGVNAGRRQNEADIIRQSGAQGGANAGGAASAAAASTQQLAVSTQQLTLAQQAAQQAQAQLTLSRQAGAQGDQQVAMLSQQAAQANQALAAGLQQRNIGEQQLATLQQQASAANQQLAAAMQQRGFSEQQIAAATQQNSIASQQAAISAQQAAPAIQQASSATQQFGSSAQGAASSLQGASSQLSSTAGQATGGMGGLGGAISGLLGPLAQAIPGLGQFGGVIMNLLNSLMSGMGGGGGGGIGGIFGSLFGGLFANGGIMSSSGPMPLKKYARGGIANKPQLAMFGEGSMNEAYVPLPDGRRIPVRMEQPRTQAETGRQQNNNVTINVSAKDAGGFRKSQPQLLAEMNLAAARMGRRNG